MICLYTLQCVTEIDKDIFISSTVLSYIYVQGLYTFIEVKHGRGEKSKWHCFFFCLLTIYSYTWNCEILIDNIGFENVYSNHLVRMKCRLTLTPRIVWVIQGISNQIFFFLSNIDFVVRIETSREREKKKKIYLQTSYFTFF